jgi:hypothetical protein
MKIEHILLCPPIDKDLLLRSHPGADDDDAQDRQLYKSKLLFYLTTHKKFSKARHGIHGRRPYRSQVRLEPVMGHLVDMLQLGIAERRFDSV